MKILMFANTEWYLYNFRRSLACALRDRGHEVLLVSPPGPYGAQLEALGFRWLAVPMQRRSLNPLREMVFIHWLSRLMKRENIDLVHSFTIKCVIYGAIAAQLARVRARVHAVAGLGYVFSSNNFKAFCLRPVVRLLMYVALSGKYSRLILQNPDDLALFKKTALILPEYIRLIRSSGADCERFTPTERQLHPNKKVPLRVLLAARLLWNKGVSEYTEAARQLLADRYALEFLLAGEPDVGNPACVPESTVKQWVKAGLIVWLGHVDDMSQLFKSVDIVVLPSYYGEGVPKSLIEAGACGVALVTTDMPGCREVVTDNVDGLLIPAKDATALARAIARLQDDPALRLRLGAAARAKVLSEFDERIVIKKTLEVYQELLGSI